MVGEPDGPMRLRIYELLKIRIIQMSRYSHKLRFAALHFVNPDEYEGIRSSPGVGERENVLKQFALLLISRTNKRILISFEIERVALAFVQQPLDQLSVHGCHRSVFQRRVGR